jgi:hypothetical protein
MTQKIVEHTHHVQDHHDIDAIWSTATDIQTMEPYCWPLDIPVDKEQLLESWFDLFKALGYTYESMVELMRKDFVEKYRQLGNPKDPIAWDMNLTHYPELTGDDRWRKFRGTVEWIASDGGDPKRATELLVELEGTYLGNLIKTVFDHHRKNFDREFKGQLNITWVGPGQRYNLHNDSNIHLRYHIPIITHPDVVWIFQDQEDIDKFYKMHMPIGEVWMLNPVQIVHTVFNKWDTPRAHILLSEFK